MYCKTPFGVVYSKARNVIASRPFEYFFRDWRALSLAGEHLTDVLLRHELEIRSKAILLVLSPRGLPRQALRLVVQVSSGNKSLAVWQVSIPQWRYTSRTSVERWYSLLSWQRCSPSLLRMRQFQMPGDLVSPGFPAPNAHSRPRTGQLYPRSRPYTTSIN